MRRQLLDLGGELHSCNHAVPGPGCRPAHDQAGGDRPHRHHPHPGARQGPGGGQGRPQAGEPLRRPARAHDATSRSSATGAARARRRHPGRDHRRQPRRCASTTAASPTRSRCSRPPTRSPRSASPTPALYRMLVGALRTLAAEPIAARERGVLLEAALARGLPPAPRRLRPLRRRGRPVHRLRPRGGRRALRARAGASAGGGSQPETLALVRRILGGELRSALAEPPERHHDRHRAARARRPRAPPRAPVCAAPRCSERAASTGRSVASAPRTRSGAKRAPATIASPYGQDRPDGPRRQPREATRLRLPVERDLRRLPVDLGLRAARRAAQAQREGRLVALDGAAARRHRRPRRRHPHGAEGVGGERAPRDLHRPARRLPQLQGALPRRPAARVGRVPELRREGLLHRGAPVQPDVQDLRRPGGGRRLGRVPAPRDRAGHLRQLPQRADDHAQEAAVRHRADRQVVPQRDHARQLHLPHARVRADGDGVLRPARGRPAVVRVLVPGALPLVHRPRHPRGEAAPAPARHRGAVALLDRHVRRRVPLPVGMGRARGHRQPHRLRPHRSTRSSPARTSATTTRRTTAATCRT